MWNSLEVAKLIADFLIPLLVVILGFVFNRRLKEIEQQNQSRIQQYEEEQQQMRDEIERRYKPHIEFRGDTCVLAHVFS